MATRRKPRRKARTSRELWEIRRRSDQLGEYRCTTSERRVLHQLLDEGWTVFNRGWPDFLAVRDGVVRLIEVKSHDHDRPSEAQRALAHALADYLGLKVEVVLLNGRPQRGS